MDGKINSVCLSSSLKERCVPERHSLNEQKIKKEKKRSEELHSENDGKGGRNRRKETEGTEERKKKTQRSIELTFAWWLVEMVRLRMNGVHH